MANRRRGLILEAIERFYEKAVPAGRAGCVKSPNGKHRFAGYRLRSCSYCGAEKP